MGKKQQQPGRSKPPSSSTKKTPARPPARPPLGNAPGAGAKADTAEETRHQQALLDVFRSAFRPVLARPDFASVLQQVKAALFNRDFEGAFNGSGSGSGAGEHDFLAVYAARWSPTRALCYSRILRRGIGGYLADLVAAGNTATATATATDNDGHQQQPQSTADNSGPTLNLLCVGGGAAELAALALYLSLSTTVRVGAATLLDTGPWSGVVSSLHASLTSISTTPTALVSPADRLRWEFVRADALGLGDAGLGRLIGSEARPLLVTLLFTLNELYASRPGGVGRTTAFLRALGRAVPRGSLLLVVDSPGSYSEAAVGRGGGAGGGASGDGGDGGTGKRRYPMQWLLDHTLLRVDEDEENREKKKRRRNGDRDRGKPASPDKEDDEDDVGDEEEHEQQKTGCRWEKLESHDSVWFRLAEGLRYPIALENMRYQMHLYRACARKV